MKLKNIYLCWKWSSIINYSSNRLEKIPKKDVLLLAHMLEFTEKNSDNLKEDIPFIRINYKNITCGN